MLSAAVHKLFGHDVPALKATYQGKEVFDTEMAAYLTLDRDTRYGDWFVYSMPLITGYIYSVFGQGKLRSGEILPREGEFRQHFWIFIESRLAGQPRHYSPTHNVWLLPPLTSFVDHPYILPLDNYNAKRVCKRLRDDMAKHHEARQYRCNPQHRHEFMHMMWGLDYVSPVQLGREVVLGNCRLRTMGPSDNKITLVNNGNLDHKVYLNDSVAKIVSNIRQNALFEFIPEDAECLSFSDESVLVAFKDGMTRLMPKDQIDYFYTYPFYKRIDDLVVSKISRSALATELESAELPILLGKHKIDDSTEESSAHAFRRKNPLICKDGLQMEAYFVEGPCVVQDKLNYAFLESPTPNHMYVFRLMPGFDKTDVTSPVRQEQRAAA